MKKLVFAMSIAFVILVAACKQSGTKTSGGTDSTALINNPPGGSQQAKAAGKLLRYTLNGIPYDDANTMLGRFGDNPVIKDDATTVLFSREVFHSMDSILVADGADGFRTYYARDTATNKNTIVVVSTFDGGYNKKMKQETHRDYFQYQRYLTVSSLQDVRGKTNYGTSVKGALLYTNPNCPPRDTCPQTRHYISCIKAQSMVKSFMSEDVINNINASSEWFDVDIINDLDAILQATPNSGLRIYFAKRLELDPDNVYRHGFVLITTKPNNGVQIDDYTCFKVKPPKHITPFTEKYLKGGTDNGEQCPTNCGGTTWP